MELVEVHLLAGPVQRVHVIHYVVDDLRVLEQVVEPAQAEWLACEGDLPTRVVFLLIPVALYFVYYFL